MYSPGKSSGRFATTTVVHLVLLLTVVLAATLCYAARRPQVSCPTGALPPGNSDNPPDLVVDTGTCTVKAGAYHYHNVNIYGGGTLLFADGAGTTTDFWAESILIENNGSLVAGSPAMPFAGTLTIHLWGADQGEHGKGIECKSPTNDDTADCGIPMDLWMSNTMGDPNKQCTKASQLGSDRRLPGEVDDCFYQYMPIDYDGGDPKGYFGYKVLALSYGGTLQLFGKKGATYAKDTEFPNIDTKPWQSGRSWARLGASAAKGDPQVTLDRVVDWQPGDQFVVSTTDYLPGHSEQFEVGSINSSASNSVITLKQGQTVAYAHNGVTFDTSSVPAGTGPDQDPNLTCSSGQTRCVETRAAVGLLSRNIQIVSGGDKPNDKLPAPGEICPNPDPREADSCVYFGGHTIVRQGFKTLQVQGVEFYQLGQGGRIMHYPVHFHMARMTPQPETAGDPAVTFVKDSSSWDSMTRWYTIHGTQGVTLARNVGFKSIGNGYYLEDGSETENKLYSNLGVFARAAIDNPQNPRKVPGIFPFDYGSPTLFWISNGWNDFQYNMASGAGSCGVCYWLIPMNNSGESAHEYFEYYASQQRGDSSHAGTTPLKNFVGNSCSTAEYSFNTTGSVTACAGLGMNAVLKPINNPLQSGGPPRIDDAGSRQATLCPPSGTPTPDQGVFTADCRIIHQGDLVGYQLGPCAAGATEPYCMITSLDRYTTSFHWAEANLGAVWLRKQWYLLSNSAVTDVLNGGLTFVSGGGYTSGDEVPGYWALAHKDIFVGNTQTGNPFSSNAGPFVPGGLTCDNPKDTYCANRNEGISLPLGTFAVNQRLFNIYDGPAYEANNAYLQITATTLEGCDKNLQGENDKVKCKDWMAASNQQKGILWDPKGQKCYLPNAAIGWKQPNGFYYPPAFHSDGLYFNKVDIRHFVIEPLFSSDGFPHTDNTKTALRYCGDKGLTDNIFANFTDIDRQTELSDDDGSLTGLLGPQFTQSPPTYFPSISVNKDAFFGVPLETAECLSDISGLMPQGDNCPYSPQYPDLCATANTSPYDYVTTVAFSKDKWQGTGCELDNCPCQDPGCPGVPLYREDENSPTEGPTEIRMMGQATGQRSTLTTNHGRYYLDTTRNFWQNPFLANGTYYVFVLFGKPTTSQIYDLFVGKSFDVKTLKKLRVNQEPPKPEFDEAGTFDCDPGSEECQFDSSTGYLSVTLDLSSSADEYNAAAEFACRPLSFCTWDSTKKSCGCNPDQTSASKAECDNACNNWATKDVRCPKDSTGKSQCYGFAFTLPGDFSADTPKGPPNVQCFNKRKDWQTDWDVMFSPPAQKQTGECDYSDKTLKATFCSGGLGNKSLGRGPEVTEADRQH